MSATETIELYHEVHGEPRPGRVPLLLVHGGGSTIETNWSAILPHLAATRPVIAVETQGHGHSPSTNRRYCFENTAEDLAALLGRIGVPVVDVLGFSNGGNAAMRLAMRHAQLVRRQIVASAFFRREGMIDGFWDGMETADVSGLPEAVVAADRAINPDPAHLQQLFDLDRAQMLAFTDWPDADLTAMTTPTLFVAGDRDVVRVEHTAAMASLVPGARLLVLPAGHGDYLGDAFAADGGHLQLHATLPWLLRFLDEPDEPGAAQGTS